MWAMAATPSTTDDETRVPTGVDRDARNRAPSRDTRAEILAVASELFAEQGYEATSLREISERLGITKAALYYYFPGKDDILRALVEPLAEVITGLMDRLEAARTVEEWSDALTWVIGMIFENADFFRLMERNRHAMQQMHDTFHEMEEHLQLHERVQVAVHATARDLPEEIRMFAALGAVTAFDDWAPKLLAEAPPDLIQSELATAVRNILGLPVGA
jgi:AcrR family transcriptional regulator